MAMAENEKVAAIVINSQANALYKRFISVLTERGETHVAAVTDGLEKGIIKMSDRQREVFDLYKDQPLLYGIEKYLETRFTPEKVGTNDYQDISEYAGQHGWSTSFTTRYTFGHNSNIGYEIQGYNSPSNRHLLGDENCDKLVAHLEGQREALAISAIAEGYAEGAITPEVMNMDDKQLWEYAVGGGFASVEVSWAEKQKLVINEATQMSEAMYSAIYPEEQ